MGALCSRNSVRAHTHEHAVVGVQGPGKSELSGPLKSAVEQSGPLQKPAVILHPAINHDFSLSEPECSDRSAAQSPLKDVYSSGAEDFSQDFGEGSEKREKTRLSRVLSTKAKAATSRTKVVARKGAAKMNEVGALFGRAGTVSIGKAVEALDTLGSSMTNINFGSGFAPGAVSKGSKIGILAFEVANTIVKGFNLKESLSDENMKLLKEEIFHSECVQHLVSNDMGELLRIAADDKRNELKVFSGEVVRFGNLCRDPQWHQLDRLFGKLATEMVVPSQSKEEAETEMKNLMGLAHHTAELYHELHALDRFEADYRRKLQEEDMFSSSNRGESLGALRSEIRSQKKHVKNLKRKSLWSKILEEVMEKLVDAVCFLHQEIENAFINADAYTITEQANSVVEKRQRLGPAGLSLHYANIINQIDNLVSRPNSVPPNTRDNLYLGLPPSIKLSLRAEIHNLPVEELTIPEIKEEMERTLAWLVPVATNTTKAHHGFGWVGEWANIGSSTDRRQPDLTLLQTLHHADQKVTERHILELVVLLHRLVSLAKGQVPGSKSPIRSPVKQSKLPVGSEKPGTEKSTVRQNGNVVVTLELSPEDEIMLQRVKDKKITPGISKSQELNTSKVKAAYRANRLSKSSSHSPGTSKEAEFSHIWRHAMIATFDFEVDKVKAMDVIDRVDNISTPKSSLPG